MPVEHRTVSTDHPRTRQRSLVSRRTLSQIRSFINSFVALEDGLDFQQITADLQVPEEDAAQALLQITRESSGVHQIAAASMLVGLWTKDPRLSDSHESLDCANRVLLNAAFGKSATPETRTQCCCWVAIFEAETPALTYMEAWLKQAERTKGPVGASNETSPDLGLWAAIALTRMGRLPLGRLLQAWQSRQAASTGAKEAAAFTLLACGTESEEVARFVARRLDQDSDLYRHRLLRTLAIFPWKSREIAEAVYRLLLNPTTAVAVRAQAAITWGVLTKGEAQVPEPLVRLLDEHVPVDLLGAAVEGIARGGHWDGLVHSRLGLLIRSDRENVRNAVLSRLTLVSNVALLIDDLLAITGTVRGHAEFRHLVESLQAAGSVAIPPLFNTLRTRDCVLTHEVASAVIRSAGPDGVALLAEELERETSPFVLATLYGSLREMGPRLAPAIQTLVRLLEQTDDASVAEVLLLTLATAGAASVEAVPALLGFMLVNQGPLSQAAERIVRMQGPAAVPAIIAFLQGASEAERAIICPLLDEVRMGSVGRYSQLAGLPTNLLAAFVEAAASLAQREVRSVPSLVASINDAGRLSVSRASLRSRLDKLNALTPKPLFLATRGAGYQLTAFGMHVLPEARMRIAAAALVAKPRARKRRSG